jgi:hypothetical protein
MSKKIKENLFSNEVLSEIKLSLGEVLVFNDGMSVYVVPVAQLEEMKEKELTEVKREIKVRKILEETKELTKKRIEQGWTRDDFKQDFLKVHEEIIQFLSKRQHGNKKQK